MIFSVWQPDGGYDYYESSVRHGIGDDLPEVKLPFAAKLGVPAQDAGRPVPPGARFVGSGTEPRGVMAPMDRSQVQGLSGGSWNPLTVGQTWGLVTLIVVGAIVWDVHKGAKWTR